MKIIQRSLTVALLICGYLSYGQSIINCDTNVQAGQNLVYNGGFELGDVGFTVPGHVSWNKLNPMPGFSVPGQYYVGSSSTKFNSAFGGAPRTGNQFLMIDADCAVGSVIWEQKVKVAKNVNYYFSAFITSLGNISTAKLRFQINGEFLPKQIVAPSVVGKWDQFEDVWYSGNSDGEVTIKIFNDQIDNCNKGNDFALDDISFSPGCGFGAIGLVPDLGPDKTLCGTDGTITLKPNIPQNGNTYVYRWSNDETTESITINKPGTYSLCMTTNGSCVKSDIIKITEDFKISLDGDKAVCKEVKDTLTIDHKGPLVSYKWYRNGILIPEAKTDTFIPTQVGTYKVEVTDGAANCGTRIDDMTLSVGSFNVDLGSDRKLCKPSNVSLDAVYEGSSYKWFLNDVRLGDLNTRSVVVNEVGTYKVEVTDPICPTVTATVNVSSETFTANNNTFCLDKTDVDLSISNTTADASNYKWYSDAALTNLVGTGLTFKTPTDLTQTTTYYVKDESVFQSTVGPKLSDNVEGGFGQGAVDDKYIAFDVTNKIVLDSVLVFPMYNQNFNVGFAVYDRATNALIASKVVPVTLKSNPGDKHMTEPTYVKLGITLEPGQYYVKNTGTTGSLHYNQGQWTPTFPYTDPKGVLSIIGLSPNEKWQAALYGFFYDWHFSSGVVCDPVEVKAVYDPVKCANCESPSTVTITKAGELNCTADKVTLTANLTGGSGTWNYSWFKNGVKVAGSLPTLEIGYADIGSYTVKVEDNAAPTICFANSTSLGVNNSNIETPTATIDLGNLEPKCLLSTLDVNVIGTTGFSPAPSDGSFEWSVNNVVDASSTNTKFTGLFKDGDVVAVKVTGKNSCGDDVSASKSVTVKGATLIEPQVSLSVVEGCSGSDIEATATVSPSSLEGTLTYTWFVNGTEISSGASKEFASSYNDKDSLSVVVSTTSSACLTKTTDTTFAIANISTSLQPSVVIEANKNDVCADQVPVTYSIKSSEFGGTPLYKWLKNGVVIPNETASTLVTSDIANGDKIAVQMTSSLSCVIESEVVSNEITSVFKPMVDVSVSLDETSFDVCNGSTVNVNATVIPSTATGSYEWRVNGLIAGTNSSSISLTDFVNGDQVNVTFKPTIECPSSLSVSSPVSATINVTNPVVEIAPIASGIWCNNTDNGFVVTDSTLGGSTPSFEWFINGVIQIETSNTIKNSLFVEGDSVSVKMIPSAPNAVCTAVSDYKFVSEILTPLDVDVQITDSTICNGSLFTLNLQDANSGKDSTVKFYLNNVLVDASSGLNNLVNGDVVKVELTSTLTCVNNQSASDSVTMKVVALPVLDLTPASVTLPDYQAVVLSTSSELNTTYVWTTNDDQIKSQLTDQTSSAVSVLPTNPVTQVYLAASVKEGNTTCTAKDTSIIIVDLEIEVPNAFSPNKDGVNDKFLIDKLSSLDNFKFTVFNKWGSIVFETSDANDLWDGTRNGKDLPVGVYYYIFDYAIAGKSYNKHDYVSLLR